MDLNPQQKEAVEATDGAVLVFAGAGSGKTMVIMHRIARLLQQGVSPFNILAVTFTNKAAEEMRNRIKSIAGPEGESVWISTFHSLANRILRYDVGKDFTIYDEQDQLVAIKECLKKLDLDPKHYPPAKIREIISNAKNNLLDVESYLINAAASSDRLKYTVGQVSRCYQELLAGNGGYDFADLLVECIRLLKENRQVREKYTQRFKYVMVDEYQDTNYAQYVLIKTLALPQNNICAVGDDDQSIYRFRGANVKNILEFEKTFNCKKTFKLERNYRSTQNILNAAHNVIRQNKSRKKKKLWTSRGSGEEILWQEFMTSREEARGVASEIMRLTLEGDYLPSDIAVFYRVNAQSRAFEDAFRQAGIKYNIVGGVRFYERKEIKDILAYMKVLVNPADDISMERIINYPSRGIGDKTLEEIKKTAAKESLSIFNLVVENPELLPDKLKTKTLQLRELFVNFKETLGKNDLARLAKQIIELTGYHSMLENDDDLKSRSRLENIEELVSAFSEKGTRNKPLEEVLAEISLVSEIDNWDESEDCVTLMTLHLAKGLEFPVVFISGLEEELFPHRDALVDPAQMEEERRLCYVGMTRAQDLLYLTSASQRMLYGRSRWHIPSRFVSEALGKGDGS